MTTAAKRAANKRWDKRHMRTLSCRVTRKEAELFLAIAAAGHKNTNQLLKTYVHTVLALVRSDRAR